jgi:hypothetical protein
MFTYVSADATTEARQPLRQYRHNNAATTPHIKYLQDKESDFLKSRNLHPKPGFKFETV